MGVLYTLQRRAVEGHVEDHAVNAAHVEPAGRVARKAMHRHPGNGHVDKAEAADVVGLRLVGAAKQQIWHASRQRASRTGGPSVATGSSAGQVRIDRLATVMLINVTLWKLRSALSPPSRSSTRPGGPSLSSIWKVFIDGSGSCTRTFDTTWLMADIIRRFVKARPPDHQAYDVRLYRMSESRSVEL